MICATCGYARGLNAIDAAYCELTGLSIIFPYDTECDLEEVNFDDSHDDPIEQQLKRLKL